MLNQTIIVGKLTENPKIKETSNNKKIIDFTLAVPRNYKNINGEYETDYITCTALDKLGEQTIECCKKGDTLGIKGRIQTREIKEKNNKYYKMELIAERVSFLSMKREPTKEEKDIDIKI